jgi:hypothetical protein
MAQPPPIAPLAQDYSLSFQWDLGDERRCEMETATNFSAIETIVHQGKAVASEQLFFKLIPCKT